MSRTAALDALLARSQPLLALAPMQDVTDLPFWALMHRYGGPDVYWTEYFRVHPDSCLERDILRSLDENPTGRPAIAQMIGNDAPSLVRSARQLQQRNIVAVDLNLGCPAPIVYRKCAGGGLLREPDRIDRLLGSLREAVNEVKFTVKTRIGFENEQVFDVLLPLFAKHGVDLVTVHGRTVLQMYKPGVRYDLIAQATRYLKCPVVANGDVTSASGAAAILSATGARGLMIGRGAIRNPWLFDQIRGQTALPAGRQVLAYLHDLYDSVTTACPRELDQVNKLKKYLNYFGEGVPRSADFLHRMRRATTRAELFTVCTDFLDHDEPMTLDPVSLAEPAR